MAGHWICYVRSKMRWIAPQGRGLHLGGLALSKGQGQILQSTGIRTGDLSLLFLIHKFTMEHVMLFFIATDTETGTRL